jgi:hypothetical protein
MYSSIIVKYIIFQQSIHYQKVASNPSSHRALILSQNNWKHDSNMTNPTTLVTLSHFSVFHPHGVTHVVFFLLDKKNNSKLLDLDFSPNAWNMVYKRNTCVIKFAKTTPLPKVELLERKRVKNEVVRKRRMNVRLFDKL